MTLPVRTPTFTVISLTEVIRIAQARLARTSLVAHDATKTTFTEIMQAASLWFFGHSVIN